MGYVPLYETYRDLVVENVCADWANTLHKSPYLDVIVDLNRLLPFKSEEFDTVLLSDVQMPKAVRMAQNGRLNALLVCILIIFSGTLHFFYRFGNVYGEHDAARFIVDAVLC